MSKLNKAQRDALPLEDFGQPSGRLYPIKDQDDVDSAAHLIGKAANPEAVKRRIIAIAKRKGLKIPDAWQSKAEMAAFADEALVTHRTKVWEAGSYPAQRFEMSPEELQAYTTEFTPVPIKSGHPRNASPLDGRMGYLQSIEVADDGWGLMGDVVLPKWLDDLLPSDERKVSATWNRETKQLEDLSLVLTPQVTDAAIYAAFARSRHDTPHGQYAIQELHDVTARNGAVCKQPTANMASRHEASAMQQAHDIAVEHGAQCAAMKPGQTAGYFSQNKERKPMSWTERMKAIFSKAVQEDPELATEVAAHFAAEPATTPHTPVIQAIAGGISGQPVAGFAATTEIKPNPEVEELKREVARLKAARIATEAAAFADAEIAAHRAYPAEREAMIATFSQAAVDDGEHGAATFAAGESKSRTQLLREQHAARPAHPLTQELIANDTIPADVIANFVAEQVAKHKPADATSDAERKRLLALTDVGRSTATFARLNGSQN